MVREKRRVVVTGLGMVTPVGLDVESTWEALREGRGGVGPISLFDAGTFPTRIAAELKEFRLERVPRASDAARWENHGRNTQIALAAAAQAIEQSGLLAYAAKRRDAIRSLPRGRRGPAGFSPVCRPDSPEQPRRARSTRACSRSSGWGCSIRSKRRSRSRERRPGTWRASSARGARTSRA